MQTKRRLLFLVSLLFVFCVATAIASPAQTFTTLANFDGTDGNWPDLMALVQGTDGNFYGTTFAGGINRGGTVFKVTPNGALTPLYSFAGPNDGLYPNAGLVLGTDGIFYGTTFASGPNRHGTVFSITAGGLLNPLYSFDGADGAGPQATLVQATDGKLYGTTRNGGANDNCSGGGPSGCGTAFAMTTGGTLNLLHSFNNTGGFYPIGALVQATNGNFYGTTGGNGFNGSDVFFTMTAEGTLTTLHAFDFYHDGSSPDGGLVQGTDGNFYGTAAFGGANDNCSDRCGTVFKITPGGTLTTLHSFDGTDGYQPNGGLVQATDGNFYGTTYSGGASNNCSGGCGTIFKITPGGTLTTLHSFDGTDGANPSGGLLQATNGTFYGTTFAGGTYDNCSGGCGTIFSLSLGLGPFVAIQPTSGKAGAAVIVLGTNLAGATSVTFNGAAAPFTIVSASEITTTVPAGATTGVVQVTTPSGTLTSNMNFRVITPLQLVPVPPCRLVDTRPQFGGSGPIQGGTFRSFPIPQEGGCNIPTTAAAYSLNVTVVPNGPLAYLTMWPTGESRPIVSTLNSLDGRIKAEAAIVPAGTNGAVSVYVTNTTNVILDIDGYFAPVSASTLAFYPLPPCRVADTRYPNGSGLGSPYLTAGRERAFPILNASACHIPYGRSRLLAELHRGSARRAVLHDGLAHRPVAAQRFNLERYPGSDHCQCGDCACRGQRQGLGPTQ